MLSHSVHTPHSTVVIFEVPVLAPFQPRKNATCTGCADTQVPMGSPHKVRSELIFLFLTIRLQAEEYTAGTQGVHTCQLNSTAGVPAVHRFWGWGESVRRACVSFTSPLLTLTLMCFATKKCAPTFSLGSILTLTFPGDHLRDPCRFARFSPTDSPFLTRRTVLTQLWLGLLMQPCDPEHRFSGFWWIDGTEKKDFCRFRYINFHSVFSKTAIHIKQELILLKILSQKEVFFHFLSAFGCSSLIQISVLF